MAAFTSAGCSTAFGPGFEPMESPQDKAIVYVYRAPTISGSMLSATPAVLVDGKRIGTLKNGGYVPTEMFSGKHTVTLQSTFFGKAVGNEVAKIAFDIAEGETRYFEFVQVTKSYERYGETEVAQVRYYFFEVPEKLAIRKLQKTRQSE